MWSTRSNIKGERMIILDTPKLKDIASKVSLGLDKGSLSPLATFLELEVKNKNLTLKITNREYFLEAVIEKITETDEQLHVTINADTFLALITKTTTETIKLEIIKEGLEVHGNGKYVFPEIGRASCRERV